MAVPIGHAAFIGAELLFLPAGLLLHRLAAVEADRTAFRDRVSAEVGLHRIGREFQNIGDAFIAIAFEGEVSDLVLNV